MWPLCVLCVLLSPIQGHDYGDGNQNETFTRPGSDVVLLLRYNLSMNKDNKLCDEFSWTYDDFTPQFQKLRISRSKRCDLTYYNYTPFSNSKTSEDGHLTLTNVTRSNSGNYTVIVTKSTGHEVFSDEYILHVQELLSEPLLNVSCLPDGGANISCRTVTGTHPVFNLTVDGDLLLEKSMSSRTVGNVSEVHVLVASPGPWNITCSVRNRVSENETKRTGENCPVPPSDPTLVGSCLHDGRLEISCLVENGTDPVFSLSANEELLTYVIKEQKGVKVTLPPSGPWKVNCSVRNNLGVKDNTTIFQACPVPPSDPDLDVSCHSSSIEVFCSVKNGTDPMFFLYVNGTLLTNVTTQEKEVHVTLPSSGPSDVHCSVRNKLREKNITTTFPACEAPLSAPIINASCHDDGSARVVCLVEDGRNTTYNWTVNGEILLWNTVPNLTINASEFRSGAINVRCSAQNSISRKESNVTSMFCEGSSSCFSCLKTSLIGGAVVLITTISPLFIASFYIGRKKMEE